MFIKKISFLGRFLAILANVDLNFWPGQGPPAPPPPPTPFPTPKPGRKPRGSGLGPLPGVGQGVGRGVGGGGGAGGPRPGQKFRSTFAKIAKILQENDIFLINTHYIFGERVFCRKKTPEGTAPASKVGWSYPITFRSLVVKHTARTQNVDHFLGMFLHFLKLFGIIWDVSGGLLEVVRSNFCRKYFRYFHVF